MIGKRLKQSRLNKKWSQKELSKRSDVSFEQISRYETGKSKPHSYIIERLASVLDVTVDFLEGNADLETVLDNQNELSVADEDLFVLADKIKTTTFSKKDKILLKGFLDLLFIRKAGEQLFSKNES